MNDPSVTALELLAFALIAVGVYLFVRLVRWGFTLIRLDRERRQRWARIGPLAEVALWMVYLVSVISWTLSGYPWWVRLMALLLLLLVVALAVWFFVRDYLAGVLLRTESTARVGDLVEIGQARDIKGLIVGFRARVVELELLHGDRIFVPYRTLRDTPIVRRRGHQAAVRHTFEVALPPGMAPTDAHQAIRRAALLSHWISPSHDPKIRPVDDRVFEVTVYALTDVRASDVEHAIRAGMGATRAPQASTQDGTA